jgi:hypothetical protein
MPSDRRCPMVFRHRDLKAVVVKRSRRDWQGGRRPFRAKYALALPISFGNSSLTPPESSVIFRPLF